VYTIISLAALLPSPSPSPGPSLLTISVLLPDHSEKIFTCDTDWTAHEAETKIQTTYKLTGGRLVRNNVTLKNSVKLDISMEGQLRFIDGISAMPVGTMMYHTGQTAATTGEILVSIDNIQSPVYIKSPTNPGSDHLSKKGFALFIRKSLSLDTSSVADHQMLAKVDDLPFCPALGNDEHVGMLPLDETEYYVHFSRNSLTGIKQSSLVPGKKKSAIKLYPGAFNKKCCVTLPSQCQPELATRVKDPAHPAFGGEMKPIEEIAMEELFTYTVIGMSDSYFSSEENPDYKTFYKSPPIGCGVLGAGPMGMLFAAEWIGVVFFSIISEPFYAGSSKNVSALQMFDAIGSSRDVSPLLIPRSLSLNSNPQQKSGVAWGVFEGQFIKIIEAPFLLKKQTINKGGFDKGDNNYREIINEVACGEASWNSNSVFFYHLYKVMSIWRKVWDTTCSREDDVHRKVFVSVELLFGEFALCLKSPNVGQKDADDTVFDDHKVMVPIARAVLWLARTWQLLYIDLRPPNLRVSEEEGSQRYYLVDYDDMVILKDKPCCDQKTLSIMRANEHVKIVFRKYTVLSKCFDAAAMADVCSVCGMEGIKLQDNDEVINEV
jgi:hypothetical protein